MRAYRARHPGVITRCNGSGMLTNLDPASALAVALLIFCFVMVVMFEATNGFHDAANAVATVIYTKSLSPGQAVVLSGFLNFLGVLLGGIAVAYALVELIPAEVLSPPNGGPAVGMLVALFVAALFWNIGTWWLALPNSSSHCLIGSLIGVAVGNAFVARAASPTACTGRSCGKCSRRSRCRRFWDSCSPGSCISSAVRPCTTRTSTSS
jgi:hypothetical protein